MSKFRITWEQHRLDGIWEADVEAACEGDARNLIEKRAPAMARHVDTKRTSTQVVQKVERVA